MTRIMGLILAMFLLGAAPLEREDRPTAATPTTPSTQAVRFTTVDIQIDPQRTPLAAYQVEFIADAGVKLVGIEGGDHAAFAVPPYYDPAALSRNRVIVAAFNTGSKLPNAEFRAARLHVQVEGDRTPQWQVKLIVASAADGSTIDASAALSEGADR